jgi:hypothetical protein
MSSEENAVLLMSAAQGAREQIHVTKFLLRVILNEVEDSDVGVSMFVSDEEDTIRGIG